MASKTAFFISNTALENAKPELSESRFSVWFPGRTLKSDKGKPINCDMSLEFDTCHDHLVTADFGKVATG